MFESVPTKAIAPAGVVAPRAVVAARNRTHAVAAEICNHEHTVRIADVVIEPYNCACKAAKARTVFVESRAITPHVDLTLRSGKVVRMRRVAIILCAALVLGLPTISSAQYNDNDQQNPKEY